MTTAVALIEKTEDRIMQMIPAAIDRDRFIANALSIAKLPAMSKCQPGSVALTIVGAARLGLDLDPSLGWAYIVPRKGVATLQIGYRGYTELANRSRQIAAIHAEVVYANDDYRVLRGTKRGIEHITADDLGVERGDARAAYCTWLDLRSNTVEFHTVTLDRINRAKAASDSASKSYSPWHSDPEAMVKKTAIRDASRYWPLTPEMAKAVRWDEQAERGEMQTIRVDEPSTGKALPDAMDAIEGEQDGDDGLDGYGPTDADLAEQEPFDPTDIEVEVR